MAIVTRFFSTSAAGAGDGTSWADRAALFSAGNWATQITGFDFSGSDSLKCLIGPGTYACSQALQSATFTNAPTAANPLILCGADSSGVLLAVPDPNWVSAMPLFDDATLPVIATTTNVQTINIECHAYLLKFTASGRNGAVVGSCRMNWCVVINTTSNASAEALGSLVGVTNVVAKCTGSSYNAAGTNGSSGAVCVNTRFEGVTGSSGDRRGIEQANNNITLVQCTIVNNGGEGIVVIGSQAGTFIRAIGCVIANNGATGFKAHATAAQTDYFQVRRSIITGNGGYGVDGQSEGNIIAQDNRLRDNTSGNFNGLDNYPTDLNNYTTDSDDATEYVDAAGGDFRIKAGSAIHGLGFGVADEPAVGGGGGTARRPRLVTIS